MKAAPEIASGAVARTEAGRLEELYRRHAPEAVRLAYLLTGDGVLAEDLVQEAFVRVAGRFRDIRKPEAFPFYLRRAVVNLSRSHFRHARVERTYVDRAGRWPAVEATVPDVEGREALWRALQHLPERQRVALVLRFYEDLGEGRMAEVMECPVGTVKSLVSRGLAALRQEMSKG